MYFPDSICLRTRMRSALTPTLAYCKHKMYKPTVHVQYRRDANLRTASLNVSPVPVPVPVPVLFGSCHLHSFSCLLAAYGGLQRSGSGCIHDFLISLRPDDLLHLLQSISQVAQLGIAHFEEGEPQLCT